MALAFFTCSTSDQVDACPTPVAGSQQAGWMAETRRAANFSVVYPCYLPNTQRLESTSIDGTAGRQKVELIFAGTFDLTVRQSQYPPAVAPDPAGASRRNVDLFPNVPAVFIERNDGTQKALYHLFWQQNGIYYELQALGPPLQSRAMLQVARSLQ